MVRRVRAGKHVGTATLTVVEHADSAVVLAEDHMPEVVREVIDTSRGLRDEIPCRDEVRARAGHVPDRCFSPETRVERVGVVDDLRPDEPVNAFGVRVVQSSMTMR